MVGSLVLSDGLLAGNTTEDWVLRWHLVDIICRSEIRWLDIERRIIIKIREQEVTNLGEAGWAQVIKLRESIR